MSQDVESKRKQAFEEILQRAKERDREAFDDLHAAFSTRLAIFCSRFFDRKADVESFAQETWFRAWQSLDTFAGSTEGEFWSWIKMIARNYGISAARKTNRMESLSTEYDIPDRRIPTEDSINIEEYRFALQDCLHAADEFEAVLRLRLLENMNYEMISKILQIPKGTVGSQLNRGKEAVKKCLEGKFK